MSACTNFNHADGNKFNNATNGVTYGVVFVGPVMLF
jgi:hypothetical protein